MKTVLREVLGGLLPVVQARVGEGMLVNLVLIKFIMRGVDDGKTTGAAWDFAVYPPAKR